MLVLQADDFEDGMNADLDPFEPLQGLYRMEHLVEKIRTIHTAFEVALAEGREPPPLGHFVFRGPPGTGKTTVARKLSQVLFRLGLLPQARFHESSGLQLTGEYIGQTKKRVHDVVSEALGGILFIDEAYELGKGLYAREAVSTLVEIMTSEELGGLVIVAAGYPKDMDEMLQTNPGLKSRFTTFIDFDSWEVEHCTSFFQQECSKEGYKLQEGEGVSDVVGEICDELRSRPGWANGRDVRSILEAFKKNRATRMLQDKNSFSGISLSDTAGVLDQFLSQRPVQSTLSPADLVQLDDLSNALAAGEHATKPAQKVSQKERVLVKEQSQENEQDKELDKELDKEKKTLRDDGVSDEEWEQLQKDALAEEEHLKELEKQKEELERQQKEEELRKLEEEKETKGSYTNQTEANWKVSCRLSMDQTKQRLAMCWW